MLAIEPIVNLSRRHKVNVNVNTTANTRMIPARLTLCIFAVSYAMACMRKQLIICTDMLNSVSHRQVFAGRNQAQASKVDDPVTFGLANILQAWGKVETLSIISSVSSRFLPPAIDAIDEFYGRGNISMSIQKPVDNSVGNSDLPMVDQNIITGANTLLTRTGNYTLNILLTLRFTFQRMFAMAPIQQVL